MGHLYDKAFGGRRVHTCKATSGIAIFRKGVQHRHIASDAHHIDSMQH